MSYENEKYITDPGNLKETIDKYGVAIIPNVLNEEELVSMRTGMWDYLEGVTRVFDIPMDRNNPKTWVEYLKMYPKHSMLLQNYSVGHSQFVWDIRQNPNVVDIFSKLWETEPEDLLTSFDGVSFHFPPEETNRGWYRNTWYHTDQSYLRPDFECVQSWVTAYDVDEGDATLAFMEKSNVHHEEFQKTFSIQDKSDWYKHTSEEQSFYEEKGCEEKRIKCSAGSMVFWDSRTIHCGTEAVKKRDEQKIRNVVYVCMTPRNLATDAFLRKKQKAFNELRMTSHWPHKPKLFAVNPRTYGGPLPCVTPINSPKLSELGLKVAGF
jgi:ectoine hydroxylase-related dioxygenase (phytanoyl-CoA dioxygenase family)